MLGKWGCEPTQQQVSARRKRYAAERHSEGEFEVRIRDWDSVLEKGSFNLTAATGCVLRDNQQASVRVGGKLAIAPESAGAEFGMGICCFVKMDLVGGFFQSGLPPIAPGVEEGALDGEDAVKASEKQGWALGLLYFRIWVGR
jgi:hypothetical protein